MKKLNKFMYYISVFLPLIDLVKGVCHGFRQAFIEVRQERTEEEIEAKLNDMKRKFYNDNI